MRICGWRRQRGQGAHNQKSYVDRGRPTRGPGGYGLGQIPPCQPPPDPPTCSTGEHVRGKSLFVLV